MIQKLDQRKIVLSLYNLLFKSFTKTRNTNSRVTFGAQVKVGGDQSTTLNVYIGFIDFR